MQHFTFYFYITYSTEIGYASTHCDLDIYTTAGQWDKGYTVHGIKKTMKIEDFSVKTLNYTRIKQIL